jgi:hypothetical protein
MMIVEVIAMIWAAAAMSLMNGEDLSVLLQMKDFPIVQNRNGVLRNYWWNSCCFRRYRFTDNFWGHLERQE